MKKNLEKILNVFERLSIHYDKRNFNWDKLKLIGIDKSELIDVGIREKKYKTDIQNIIVRAQERFKWVRDKDALDISQTHLCAHPRYIKFSGGTKYERSDVSRNENNSLTIKEFLIILEKYSKLLRIDKTVFIDPDIKKKRFTKLVKEMWTIINDPLEDAIHEYRKAVKRKNEYKILNKKFTPLDIEENPELKFPTEVYEIRYEDDFYEFDESIFLDEEEIEKEKSNKDDETKRQYGDVHKLIDQNARLILLGEPGGGKTTCLKYKHLQGIKSYEAGGMVYIYIPLGKFRQTLDDESLKELIYRSTKFSKKNLDSLLEELRYTEKTHYSNKDQAA